MLYMRTLRSSQRKGIKGDKVVYSVMPSTSEKFRRKAYSEVWREGGYGYNPSKIRRK